MKWEKNCPNCNKLQSYKNKYLYERAAKENSLCLSCAARIGYWNNIDHDDFKRNCYVYGYFDPNDFSGNPFYIGKGSGDRCYVHLKDTKETTNNIWKFNKIQKLIRDRTPPIIKILAYDLTAKEAYAIETAEIDFLGRSGIDLAGVLTNRIRDYKPPDRTGTHFSEKHKKNHKEAIKKFHKEYKEKYGHGINYGMKRSAKMIEWAKERYKNGIGVGGLNFKGSENPRALIHKFISPFGEIFIVKGEFKKFCKDHELSAATIRKSYKTGVWPTYGKCLGWKYEKLEKLNLGVIV